MDPIISVGSAVGLVSIRPSFVKESLSTQR